MTAPALVIFDCDGVLVDSEPIAISVLTDFLHGLGLPVGEAFAYRNFLGRSWPTVVACIERRFGCRIGEDDAATFRARLIARFEADLAPMAGAVDALDALDAAGVATCVASSSMPERLHASLRATGLLDRFGPRVFSAAEVPRGKPAPDLFLHAAARMGASPADCLVIEDSPSGIEAARAAGMRVVAFLGGGHVGAGGLEDAVRDAAPDVVLRDLRDLPAVVLGAPVAAGDDQSAALSRADLTRAR